LPANEVEIKQGRSLYLLTLPQRPFKLSFDITDTRSDDSENPFRIFALRSANGGDNIVDLSVSKDRYLHPRYQGFALMDNGVDQGHEWWRTWTTVTFVVTLSKVTVFTTTPLLEHVEISTDSITPMDLTDQFEFWASPPGEITAGGWIRNIVVTGKHVAIISVVSAISKCAT
jgi:hypothetical protein